MPVDGAFDGEIARDDDVERVPVDVGIGFEVAGDGDVAFVETDFLVV